MGKLRALDSKQRRASLHFRTVTVFYTTAVSSKWQIYSFTWIKNSTTKSRFKGDPTSLLWKVYNWKITNPTTWIIQAWNPHLSNFRYTACDYCLQRRKPLVGTFAQWLYQYCILKSETNTVKYLKGNCQDTANTGEPEKRWNKTKTVECVGCKIISWRLRFYLLNCFLNKKKIQIDINLERLIFCCVNL